MIDNNLLVQLLKAVGILLICSPFYFLGLYIFDFIAETKIFVRHDKPSLLDKERKQFFVDLSATIFYVCCFVVAINYI